jgi:hypothetical protein
MKKIVHRQDVENLSDLPVEVSAKAEEIAGILDDEYGVDRHWNRDLGGYILIAESEEDVKSMEELIDFDYVLPEIVELISCKNGEKYTSSLMLLSSDYSISLLIPLIYTPKSFLGYLETETEGRLRA